MNLLSVYMFSNPSPYSRWKQKEKPDEVEDKPNLSKVLPDYMSCYKLMNGSKVYFRHSFPHELYIDSSKKVSNLPDDPLYFSGEINNSLYFYTKHDQVAEMTYMFYKASFSNTSAVVFEWINELTTEKEVKFALQQPYYLIQSDESATFNSFEGDKLTLSDFAFEAFKKIESYSFVVWRECVVIITNDCEEDTTLITPALVYNRAMSIVRMQNYLPLPTSAYGQDTSLLCMVFGTTLIVFQEHLKTRRFELDRPDYGIGGVSKRQILLNAPNLFRAHEVDHQFYRSLSVSWGDGLTHNDEAYESMANTETRTSESIGRSEQRKLTDYGMIRSNASESIEKSSVSSATYESEFLNKFTVKAILGEGGFGSVFKVVHKIDNWPYAVKRVAVDPKELEQYKDEVRAMAQLTHPGIVRYYGTWIEKPPEGWQYEADCEMLKEIGSPLRALSFYKADSVFIYIQMQLYNNSLYDWIKVNQGPTSRELSRIKRWFKQIVEAVDYIHGKDLIHRDLKPANVLVDDNDHIIICDLGIVTERRIGGASDTSATRTQIGSKLYMSPEQSNAMWSHYSSKTDVFSLGLILAELCVVMTEKEREIMFNCYREGETQTGSFGDEDTANFVAWLARTDPKNRPACAEILKHSFLSV